MSSQLPLRVEPTSFVDSPAVITAPGLVLLLFGVPELLRLHKSKSFVPSHRPTLCLKVVLALLLFFLHFYEIVWRPGTTSVQRADESALVYFPPAFDLFSSGFAIFLQLYTSCRQSYSSTSLLLFYLAYTSYSAAVFWSFLDRHPFPSTLYASLWIADIVFPASIFGLELLGPSGWHYPPKRGYVLLGDNEDSVSAKESPVNGANVFSMLLFTWVTPILLLGSTRTLRLKDVWRLPPHLEVTNTDHKVNRALKSQLAAGESQFSLLMALITAFWKPWLGASAFKFVQVGLAFTQPQLLRKLLVFVASYNTEDPHPASDGYRIAVLILVVAVAHALCLHCSSIMTFSISNQVLSSVRSVLYRKTLVISSASRSKYSTGDITNLMSVDANVMEDLAHLDVLAPNVLDAIPGVLVMLLATPLATRVTSLQSTAREKQLAAKDARTRFMSEIINNIRTIKLNAWEVTFSSRLSTLRNNQELAFLRRRGVINSAADGLANITPFCVAFVSFACFATISGKPLTPDIVFPALAIFALLSQPILIVPYLITMIVDSRITIKRLDDFLNAEELQGTSSHVVPESSSGEVSIVEGTFTWDSNSTPTLSDIDFRVEPGHLCAVVGRIGAGKTSLLAALLGEISKRSGSVTVRGSIACTQQQPWLFSGTIRENITFGREFDHGWYNTVLEACALVPDLSDMQLNDQTQVGEKGTLLSGGQRARVSLARAVYSKSDIYLLDDPLSAVDARVARDIFDRVIGNQGLLAGTTRVFSTSHVQLLPDDSKAVLVIGGQVAEEGVVRQLRSGDSQLSQMFQKQTLSERGSEDESNSKRDANNIAPEADGLQEVASSTGAVSSRVFRDYMKACSVFGVTGFLVAVAVQQIFSIAVSVTLKSWAQQNSTTTGAYHSVTWWLTVYGILGLSTAVAQSLASYFSLNIAGLRAARRLHDSMFTAVLRSPMRFFDSIPSGSLQSRMSADVTQVDENLAPTLAHLCASVAAVAATLSVIGFSAPLFLLLVVPLSLAYWRVQQFFIKSSRELARLGAESRSPIFNAFQQATTGASTIRAFGQHQRMVNETISKISQNQSVAFLSAACRSWLAVRLELLAAAIVFASALLGVYKVTLYRSLNEAAVGLMLNYALSVTRILTWLLHGATDAEMAIIAVERIQEFASLPPETASQSNEEELSSAWPAEGAVKFSHISARYRPDADLALKDVTFSVFPGEKIGIVGRTGAGKSTLSLALSRMISLESGSITIDGVDLEAARLEVLRARITAIPQEAQCFEGSLRWNLDPAATALDTALWEALNAVRLRQFAESLDGRLDGHVEEGGRNLSAGQRQLLCFARALLRDSKVIVIDEGTASMDRQSDAEIQEVLRTSFAGRTLLIVAHRIETVLQCDNILVMAHGCVVESGSPSALLADKTSMFSSYAESAHH